MSSTTKPEFVIVPGAWHHPSAFQPMVTLLEKAGYTVHGVPLASVGANPPLEDFTPDVRVIRSKIHSVLASGKDVVLVMHSYGGSPGSEALAEYLAERATKEGPGKVRRLVYISSFVLSEGGSLTSALGGHVVPWIDINEEGTSVLCKNPHEVFYNDMEPSVAQPYIDSLKPQSYKAFHSQVTVAPWKIIPSTYVLCDADNAIPVQAQEGMIAAAQEVAPSAFDVVERTPVAHSPFISQPEWLAEKLIKAAA